VAADDASKSPRPFDVRTIKTLVGLMTQHDLSEIDLHEGEHRIRLRRGTRPAVVQTTSPPAPVAPSAPTPGPSTPPPAAVEAKAGPPNKAYQYIKSPTPGTFYAKPNPDAPPFVTAGSRVTPETVVCTIEAMKIFNEIQAECTGVITKVMAENGQAVEWGTPLFEVDPTG
jgi:acetyl-CoA carboxylase biotin carboxyl carrier protein